MAVLSTCSNYTPKCVLWENGGRPRKFTTRRNVTASVYFFRFVLASAPVRSESKCILNSVGEPELIFVQQFQVFFCSEILAAVSVCVCVLVREREKKVEER